MNFFFRARDSLEAMGFSPISCRYETLLVCGEKKVRYFTRRDGRRGFFFSCAEAHDMERMRRSVAL